MLRVRRVFGARPVPTWRAMAASIVALSLVACTTLPDLVEDSDPARTACVDQGGPPRPTEPINIALSGGGYRAMLFHVGTLWRLHELGLLRQASNVSSVSAGSITSAVLARQWNRVDADWAHANAGTSPGTPCFRALVAEPLMKLADHTIDVPAVVEGLLSPSTAAGRLESRYKSALYGNTRLGDLPGVPSFVFNATNLQTGDVWTFRRDLMGDARLGYTPSGTVYLAQAVIASSAFPPYLSPLMFRPRETAWRTAQATPQNARVSLRRRKGSGLAPDELDRYREVIPLIDGGVADNLGIEAVWDLPGGLLISDGGGTTPPDAHPSTDWLSQMIRVLELATDQPSELRANAFIQLQRLRDPARASTLAHVAYDRDGAYWDIGELPGAHRSYCTSPVDAALVESLWNLPTRLQALPEITKKQLVNWGYHAADFAMPYLRRPTNGTGGTHLMSAHLPFPEATIFVPDKLEACVARGNWEP